jgi:hypothetical protein
MLCLSNLFLELLTCLSPTCPAHLNLFEAIAFVVIDRSAELLYNIEFGHARAASISDELKMDESTIGATPPASPSRQSQNQEIGLACEEAKYIFPVLKRIIAMAQLFYQSPEEASKRNPTKPAGASRSKTTGQNYNPKTAAKLSIHVREKLQRTLIDCIWDEHDEGNEFEDSLRKPIFHGPLPQLPKGCNEGPSWFKGEMWKLLGWEELGKERGGDPTDTGEVVGF